MAQPQARGGRVAGWYRRSPRWLRGAVSAVAVVVGGVIVSRPTTSLGVLALLIGAGLVLSGVLELVERPRDTDQVTSQVATRPSTWQVVGSVLLVAAGLVVLVLPGLTVRLVAVIVGVALVVNGGLRVLSAVRGARTLDARVATIATGIAEVVFGVLALLWPDITLLVVAVVFGARLVVAGLVELWNAVRGTRTARTEQTRQAQPSASRRWVQTTAAVLALLVAVGAALLSARLHGGSPVVDDFYAAPRQVPDEPGRLIRSEPFSRDVPADAVGWRILYTTTRGDGSATVASGLVVVPRDGQGPWPVIDWSHGTTGFAQHCAPSLANRPFESGAFFLLDHVIDRGWALVATDYIGLGTAGPHPYLIGPDTAHAVLDAARAARELTDAHLGEQNVVWGHSQGGGGALWTGALAREYAPDVDIQGVAALAPASNLTALVSELPNITGGSVFASYVVGAYTAIYDDVTYRRYIRPGAQVTVREMAERCLGEPGVFVSVLNALALTRDPQILSRDPTTGALGQRLAENTPPPTVAPPLLLAQGAADSLVLRPAQDEYVDTMCAAGQQVDYRVYEGRDHVGLVEPDSPLVADLVSWTADRLDGRPAAGSCARADG